MLIGELLVRAGAVTPADLEEAIGWQVLYGGRLGTNLLELGLVHERALAEALGRQHGCEFAWGDLHISEAMAQTISPVMARRNELVPWKSDGNRLRVLCSAPGENVALFDELAFRTGKIVKPVVAPEFRIHQLLRRHFSSVRPMRALDFGVRPKDRRAQEADKKVEEKALEEAADLMSDEAFAAVYSQLVDSRTELTPPSVTPISVAPVAGPPPGWSAMPPRPLTSPHEDDDELPLIEAEIIEEDDDELPVLDGAPDPFAAAFQQLEQEIEAMQQPPAPEPELGPLTFDDAVQEISRADGRDAVAHAVLRYARSRAARAVLLSIQGDVALGWDGVGEDLSPEVARKIALPLTVPSAFRLVRESRSHYIGPLGPDRGNVRFLKLAGRKWPASAVLLPVLFRGRVVYILYVDNGHRKHVDADVGELLILSQNISRSMEQLVASRQRARMQEIRGDFPPYSG